MRNIAAKKVINLIRSVHKKENFEIFTITNEKGNNKNGMQALEFTELNKKSLE